MYETDEPDVHICHIKQFPLSTTKQESFIFHVNYAQPTEIEEMHIGATPKIMRTLNPNNVENIPPEIFSAFFNLQYFRMSTNLKALTSVDFAHAMNLTSLNLNDNKLKIIQSNVFSPIEKTHDGAVFPLHKLRELSIERNEISEIESNSFYGLNNLFDVNFSGNQLTTISSRTFAGLPSLNYLDLTNNRIEIIQEGALDLRELKQLNLAHNKLTRLTEAIFDRLPKLESIILDFNNLEYIGNALSGLANVADISLDRNDIQDIDLAAFAKLPSLKKLILTQSGFTFAATKLEEQKYRKSPLIKLNVGGNYLNNAVELNILGIFPSLEYLGLSWNSFTNLDAGGNQTLKDIMPSLEMLDLYGNTMDSEYLLGIERKLNAQNVEVRR